AGVGSHTASDFPMARLDQIEFAGLSIQYPSIEDVYPLSPLQQGLLFHSLYDETNDDPYHVQACLTLTGDLDVERLYQAWKLLFERHASLRVAVARTHGVPLQVVRGDLTLPWHFEDWSHLDEAAFQSRLDLHLQQDRERRFEFDHGPLLRLSLMRHGRAKHVLLFSNHHLLLDGWSMPVLLRELLTIYGALGRRADSGLPRARSYRDYIAWLGSQDVDKARSFWRDYLSGIEDPAQLLFDEAGSGGGGGCE